MADAVLTTECACALCGATGRWATVLTDVRDNRYGVTGTWSFRRCRGCGLVVLHPPPGDHADAYPPGYSQHKPPGPLPEARSPIRRRLRTEVLATLGYPAADPHADPHAARHPAHHPDPHGDSHATRQADSPPARQAAPGSRLGAVLSRVEPVRLGAQAGFLLVPPAKAGGRLLDVGCGNGRFLAAMAALGWDVSGVEVDPTSAEVARRASGAPVVADIDDGRFAPASFDVITMNHVIEHVEDPVAILRRLRPLLAPDGRLGLATPNWSALTRRLFGRSWYTLEAPRHPILFDPKTLVAAVEKAGFRVTSLATRWAREAPVNWRVSWRYRFGRTPPRALVAAGSALSAIGGRLGDEIELWAEPGPA